MHLRFLKDYLMKVGDVYLVSRLKDSRLQYPSSGGFRVFIPDLHLIDKEREQHFKYSTNNLDLLGKCAQEFINFKQDASRENIDVYVYQLGDFMDLWREIPVSFSKNKATDELKKGVQKIMEDHIDQVKLLRDPGLKTQFLLGNHDFDLHYLTDFVDSELSYYFPISSKGPSAFALHGDAFSMLERNMPAGIKNLAVYIVGPGAKPDTKQLGQFRKETVNAYKGKDFSGYIQQPTPAAVSRMMKIGTDQADIDGVLNGANFNIKHMGDPAIPACDLRYAQEAEDFAMLVNKEHSWDIRFSVIGHTHYARIILDERDGFFALVDCGAWIEYCQGSGITLPCAQIGVIYDNEARIYQIASKNR